MDKTGYVIVKIKYNYTLEETGKMYFERDYDEMEIVEEDELTEDEQQIVEDIVYDRKFLN